MLDFKFLEFYIDKKYSQKVEEYFNIHKMSVSGWRKSNQVPPKRLIEFHEKEGTLDVSELFKILYESK
jgi:hypothetical protein